MILKARHVLPVTAPPIKNGLVVISGGRIVEVRRAARRESSADMIDCGDAVLLPGLVNAHTHLDLTHLADRVPPARGGSTPDFADWLGRLVTEAREAWNDADTIAASVSDGVKQCLRAGVTTIGDVARRPSLVRPHLKDGRLRVVSFGEVIAIGSLREALAERLRDAMDPSCESDRLTAAVSPHSLYTCDRRAIRACRQACADGKLRLCMHLAESREEALCVSRGEGPLADLMRSIGLWDGSERPPGIDPIRYAEEVGLLSPRTLLAHVNYASDADLSRLAGGKAHVVYCPRTHTGFGHPPHRFRDMLARGINVCVGTDSRASSPSLSMLGEIRHLRSQDAGIDGSTLIEMATLRGAAALGVADRLGSLESGKRADLVAIPFDTAGDADPVSNMLGSVLSPSQVYVGGVRIDG